MKLKLDYVSNQPQKIHADRVEQVHVSIKFGENGFSGFGDFAFLVKFPFRTIVVHGSEKIESNKIGSKNSCN